MKHLRLLALAVTLALVLSSCAQPPPPKKYVSKYTNDFASRLELNVTYEEPDTMGVYMKNAKRTQLKLWLILNHSVPGERVLRETLVYEGNKMTLHKVYRLPQGTDGIEGSLYLKALNANGQELIRSETIRLSSTIGD